MPVPIQGLLRVDLEVRRRIPEASDSADSDDNAAPADTAAGAETAAVVANDKGGV